MIEVKELSKYYGAITAVDNISFKISKGEIIGFLGPNGAGKTTTMKILTCFMRPSKGEVKVGGYDIYDNPIEVKKLIGYLPETNPLYLDMRVSDYLKYIGRLKDVDSSKLQNNIEKVIAQCGLEKVFQRKIGNLSKGYRQRVGLAQAIIADPPILILDEPTSGLDPNQIIEIRELIKKLGEEKTVILSTHILPEVESTCNRILIINNGKLVADGSKEELGKVKKNTFNFVLTVKLEDKKQDVASIFSTIEEINSISLLSEIGENVKSFEIETEPANEINEKIFYKCVENNLIILEFKKIEYSLEDIFKQLTLQ